MPPKIRELIEILKSNNFQNRGGKGGHKNFLHQSGVKVTVSGNPGDNVRIPINSASCSGRIRPLFGAKRRGLHYYTIVAGLRSILVFGCRSHFLPHGLSFHIDDVSVMDDPVQDCIRDGCLPDQFVPFIDRKLAGNDQ